MAYGISNTQIQMPDIVGGYAAGLDYGEKKAEQERRRPIVEQLEQLKLKQSEQAIKTGDQKMSLQDFSLKEAKRKQESADMADFGRGAAWAMNQPNPSSAWEQVLNQYQKEGKPVDQFRGRADLMPMVRDLNNPDYAKQQAIQNNLSSMVQTLPPEKRGGAQALAAASPQAFYKAYGDQLMAGDTSGQLDALISPLPEEQKKQVTAVYSADQNAGVKLASDLIKQQSKPKTEKKKTSTQEAATAFYDRMVNSDTELESIISDGYTPSSLDRYATGSAATNWMASKEGQQYWNAASEWIRSKLRKESGAAISDNEWDSEAKTYFPVANDSQEVIAQKKRLRKQAEKSMSKMAGISEPEIPAGFIDNGDGTFTMPNGIVVERE